MDITRYETALRALNATQFEELIHDIISREYGQYSEFQIEHIGKTHEKQAPAKGTPDIWFSYKKDNNKKNIFVEITTQTTQLFTENGKVITDLQKCKRKIQNVSTGIDTIIYACTSSIEVEKKEEYEEFCASIGCEFIFWGIGTIISILKLKYPILIPAYLGMQINRGNVISIHEFIKSNKFGVTEENKFIYRETDSQKVIDSLLKVKSIILSGAAGCGKTRLALEIANSLRENNEFETYWIKMCNIDVIDDIINSVSTPKNCLIVIDDANRLPFVRDILNFANARSNIYLILTVRDYAIDVVKNGLNGLSFSNYQLLPLTHDQIKEVVRQGFNINNSEWLDYILSISKGNLRFAIMTTEILTKKSATPTTIDDVLKTYYQEIYKDIDLQKDSKIENFLVAVSFFKRFDMRDENFVAKLSDVFSFEKNKFYEYVRAAEENELVNLHFDDNVVEIADQILADYLCYKIIILEKKVSLVEVFEQFFTQYENKFVDVIQSLINIYGDEVKLMAEIKQLRKLVQNINSDDLAIQFFQYFANIFPDECLKTCVSILSNYEGENLEFSKFKYTNVSRAANIICSFHENCDYTEIAIEYLMSLLRSKENLRNVLIGTIKEVFTINKYSFGNGYKAQIKLLNKSLELVKKSANYTDILFAVVEMFYPLEVEATEAKSDSIVFYRISYANCAEFRNLRQLFWEAVKTLIDNDYTGELTKLLYKNAYGSSADYGLRNIDKDYAVEIYNSTNNDSLKNKIFKFALLSPYRKMEGVKSLLDRLSSSLDMKLYSKYICSLTSKRLYGNQLLKEIGKDFNACNSAEEIIEAIINLENACQSENSWDLSEVTNGAFICIHNNFGEQYDDMLFRFLDGAPDTHCQPLTILQKVNNKTSVLLFLQASDIKNRSTWIAQFYLSLKITDINDTYYDSAKLFFMGEYYATTLRWGNEQLINLEAFEEYKSGFLVDILKYCIDNQVFAGTFIGTIFYGYKPIDELLKLFGNDIDLLGKTYLLLIQTSHGIDLHGDFAKYLITYDNTYLTNIIKIQLKSHNDYYRLKNLYELPNFIDELIVALKNEDRLYWNFQAQHIVSELSDQLYLDFLDKYVSLYRDDKEALFDLACITRDKDNNQITLLDCLFKYNVASDIISKLPILEGPSSWSGSLVPYLKKTLELLNDYIEKYKNLAVGYKSLLVTLRERLKEYIKNTEIREFNDDRFGK